MIEKKKLSYPQKVTWYMFVNLLTMTMLLVLIGGAMYLYPRIDTRNFVAVFVTVCTILTFIFLYRDLRAFPSREETRAFLGTLGILTLVLIIIGMLTTWLVGGSGGVWVYAAMVGVPAIFAIGITSFDQAYREQAVSQAQYGCDRVRSGSYVVYLTYQLLMYLVVPYILFAVQVYYPLLGVFLVSGYLVEGLVFMTLEHNKRKHRKQSFFWKNPVSKK